jgi:hypothetical protein
MPKVVRCPNCHAPLPVDPEAPVIRCPYCHADVKQTIAIQPPREPEPPPRVPELQKQVIIKELVRVHKQAQQTGRAIGCVVTLAVLVAIGSTVGVSLWRTGALRKAVTAVQGAVKGDPEPAIARKLDTLVDLHSAATSVRRSYERYASWQQGEDGPSCRERHISWGLYEVHAAGSLDNAQKALGVEPRLPDLDAVASSFAAALREAETIFNDARRYYDHGDYKDDGCKRGRELHGRIAASYARVESEARRLREALVREVGGFLARRHERWSRERPGGKNAATVHALIRGRELAFSVDRHHHPAEESGADAASSARAGRSRDTDLEQITLRIAPLEQAMTAAARAENEAGDDDRFGYVLYPYTFRSHFNSRFEELVKSIKAYARAPGPEPHGQVVEAWNAIVGWAGWAGPELERASERRAVQRQRVALEPVAPVAPRTLSAEVVRRVVTAHRGPLTRCLGGRRVPRVVLRFTVGANGRVSSAEVAEPPELTAPARGCIVAQVRRWGFPAPGQELTITYPLRFE